MDEVTEPKLQTRTRTVHEKGCNTGGSDKRMAVFKRPKLKGFYHHTVTQVRLPFFHVVIQQLSFNAIG
jgi:hypothetical protein